MRRLGRNLRQRQSRQGKTIAQKVAALFSAGEQGVWYDPSDFSTMFQDAAGTTPVTAVGQPVGRILDKSGRGNHATQATAASRPVLQQDGTGRYFLLFDGTDDWLQTASINFTSTDKVTMWAGVRKLSDASSGILVDLSEDPAVISNTFSMLAPSQTGANSYRFNSRGNGVIQGAGTGVFAEAPNTSVLTGIGNISGDITQLRRNAVVVETNISDQGTGNYGNYPLYIGKRSVISINCFNGRLYSLIVRGAQSTATQISNAETYVNSKTGAY